jgi:hypothetical protein
LFLCNSIIYREAAKVFFGGKTFNFSFEDGEVDWDMLYGWLKTIGRRNICHLRHLKIAYDSVDVRIHKENHKISEQRCYDLNGVPFGPAPKSDETELDGTTPDRFEVISPSIERVFRKLSQSGGPLTVTMSLPNLQGKLLPRLLYPYVDLQEYDPLPLFDPFGPRETSLQEWHCDEAGATRARYSPKEFCMLPDLMEGYRKKYGKNNLSVQWEGRQYADKWDKTKHLLLRSGWEILHWEETGPEYLFEPEVDSTLRLERDLTHGCVLYDVSAYLNVKGTLI